MKEKQIHLLVAKIYKCTDDELNNLPYNSALKKDKRTYCIYYVSLIRIKHLLFFSFIPKFDYNSRTLKIFFFFFNFATNFTVNALFFNEKTLHIIYINNGTFDFVYNIPQILYSSLISGFINILIKTLALSDTNLVELKKEENKSNIKIKAKKTLSILKMKFLSFFIISFLLLILFWFYLACFCAVYKNTQLYLIKDTLISFVVTLIYPFALYLIPGIFRIYSLKRKKKQYIYNFSKLIQMI